MPYPNHTAKRGPVASGHCNRPAVDRFIQPALISRDGPYACDACRQQTRTNTTNAGADTDRHTYVYDCSHALSGYSPAAS